MQAQAPRTPLSLFRTFRAGTEGGDPSNLASPTRWWWLGRFGCAFCLRLSLLFRFGSPLQSAAPMKELRERAVGFDRCRMVWYVGAHGGIVSHCCLCPPRQLSSHQPCRWFLTSSFATRPSRAGSKVKHAARAMSTFGKCTYELLYWSRASSVSRLQGRPSDLDQKN